MALIMAPTRELVVQIGKDIRRFSKALSLSIVCAYGGSAVAGQISDLKRGAEVQNPPNLSPSRYAPCQAKARFAGFSLLQQAWSCF